MNKELRVIGEDVSRLELAKLLLPMLDDAVNGQLRALKPKERKECEQLSWLLTGMLAGLKFSYGEDEQLLIYYKRGRIPLRLRIAGMADQIKGWVKE